jgi:hypothetical protein
VADVFRRGRKDVHRAIVSGDPDDPMRPNGCSFDGGGEWGPVIPAGPRCSVCFAALSERSRNSRGRGKAPLLGTAAALALAAAVFASSLGEPVNFFPYPSSTEVPVLVTPGPATVPPPSLVPAPIPTFAVPTLGPAPTWPPVPTYPPTPTFGPLPTFPPLPTFGPLPTLNLPLPTTPPIVKVCVHPGTHLGVDPCKWPHNR